ncbi:hypothetical protein [Halobacteriovorax sp. JY17]|uniref:hypothetical protein n=1 Tax=Halobacteriovorax sp. JY17 TaxID=2014617 RepID=UPI000C501DBB|nr:hypothetical protein [Halobacteriovorax sp. JY17]PIK16577.1 MAG: hypothetical protein CES88_07490 [Halobacteriovorax sp. JY17]
MSTKYFKAQSWLNSTPSRNGLRPEDLENTLQGSLDLELPMEASAKNYVFKPQNFLVPGWSGEGLFSKPGFVVKKAHKHLISDAKSQFKEIINRNISQHKIIYNEFSIFLEARKIEGYPIDSPIKFSNYISSAKEFDEVVTEFIDLYCFRSVIVYLYKARFLLVLAKRMEISFDKIDLHNPNSILSRIFKTGSSSELKCESFKIHQFSWYRPSHFVSESIREIKECLTLISTTEMIKLATYDLSKLEYSHSYSHKSFGLLINKLLIHFPKWLENSKSEKAYPLYGLLNGKSSERVSALTTKFAGNNLSSLSLSHWMAQENNVIQNWSEVICPEFKGDEFFQGKFTQICQEIQFLTFLVDLATYQGHDLLGLICKIMNDKFTKSNSNDAGQMSIFGSSDIKTTRTTYDRVVLNLTDLPKKNPHHFLMGKVSNELKDLNRDGYLFVFTNQKFFVPSHNDKVEQFLKDVRIEAMFNLDQLNGRGEIASFLYVFKKRKQFTQPAFLTPIASSEKEACLSFNWSGNLEIFNKFETFVDEFQNFMDTKSCAATPVYQAEPCANLSFDFHQDAILDGLLLSSTSKDSSSITHPSFFKNLTKSCVPLDSFFQIESFASEQAQSKKGNLTSDLLGITIRKEERFPLLLIVNYTNPKDITLELTSADVYQAKLEEYGMAYFQYFGLIPKRNDINLNVFREYFNTQLGRQIIQLFLNGGDTKIKSKLRSLLVPKFFLENNHIPTHILDAFKVFNNSSSEILNSHPIELTGAFDQSVNFLNTTEQKYPWHTLGMISHFKLSLTRALEKLDHTPTEIFKNPVIVEQLVSTSSQSIYPKSADIFVRMPLKNPAHIHLPLTQVEIGTEGENHYVELLSGESIIIQLYTSSNLAQFIKFILSSALGMEISSILQNMKVPSATNIDMILSNHSSLKDALIDLQERCSKRILSILTTNINS